jgi:mannosyltransferase OCH1-like enzyme
LKKSGRDLIHNKPKSILNNNDGEKITMTPNFLDLDTTYEFTPKIPKIIHQQWKDQNVPKKFMKWRTMWFRLFPKPEYTHMLWDDESGRNLIKEHYPWFLDAFDGYTHNINRVDATRYFILYHYGGIYADLDYEPVVNFFQHLPQNIVGIIESPYFWNERTQNSLMSSPKGDPFWIDVFDKLIQNTKKDNILEITGPILMDQAIESSSHPAYILPCENFQRVPLGEYSETLPMIIVQREMTFRLQRLNGKHCGFYSDNRCHFGKHHNTASYVTTRGGGGIL